jgi:hypothetical protein
MPKAKTKITRPAVVKKVKTKSAPVQSASSPLEEMECCGHQAHFGKIIFGLALVLFGLFCLGRNLGLLPALNFNFQSIWPILLILIGLLLVNRRSRVSIIVGVFAALVFMLILTFVVNFKDSQDDYDSEAVMPLLPQVEKVVSTSTAASTSSADIKLDDFVPGAVVASPFALQGTVRGNWFFEGSFPVKVLDESGQELGRGIAQAQGNWMTADFVPFKATIMFARPTSSVGSLVLENDNPSGLPENSKQVIIPIKF